MHAHAKLAACMVQWLSMQLYKNSHLYTPIKHAYEYKIIPVLVLTINLFTNAIFTSVARFSDTVILNTTIEVLFL